MATVKVLFFGDVCAEAGRKSVRQLLPRLKQEHGADLIVVNAENAAGGYGLTARTGEELLAAGADCLTTGDHSFDRKDSWLYFRDQPKLLRPLNYPAGVPGRGWAVFAAGDAEVAVVSLLGRVFMKPLDCPFQRVEPAVRELRQRTRVIIVDFHAEATAEKQAMGVFLDGGVSAVLGTHTHVQTADERVLAGGTAYITDVGMCGAFDSVLGMRKDDSLLRIREGIPHRLHPATGDPRVNAVVVEVDRESGRAQSIVRLDVPAEIEPEPEAAAEPISSSEPA